MSTDELLIRLDERVATLIERIDSMVPTLEEMRDDIQENTERSLENKHKTERHESMISWTIRAVLFIVIGVVLAAAGVGIPS